MYCVFIFTCNGELNSQVKHHVVFKLGTVTMNSSGELLLRSQSINAEG